MDFDVASVIAVKRQRLRVIGPRPLPQLPPAAQLPPVPESAQLGFFQPAEAQNEDPFSGMVWGPNMTLMPAHSFPTTPGSNELQVPAQDPSKVRLCIQCQSCV